MGHHLPCRRLRFGDFQLLAVYTRSTLAEQSTPVTAGFSDTFAAVAAWNGVVG